MKDWDRIRANFSEMEKKIVNESIVSETICPRGCLLDEAKAGSVGVKVKQLLGIRDGDGG